MLNEKFINPKSLRLTHYQKMVLRTIKDNESPKVAAEQLSNGREKVNLKAAAIILNKYGLIQYDGNEASITDSGSNAVDEYNIVDDPSLVQATPPSNTGGDPAVDGADMGPTTGEEPDEELDLDRPSEENQDSLKDELGLESLHVLKDINNILIEKRLLKSFQQKS